MLFHRLKSFENEIVWRNEEYKGTEYENWEYKSIVKNNLW